jgi:hypothetical protein
MKCPLLHAAHRNQRHYVLEIDLRCQMSRIRNILHVAGERSHIENAAESKTHYLAVR